MANGFVVTKLHNHIRYASKIKSTEFTPQRKYKTNSSSQVTLKLLNKILDKTLQNTLGVKIIFKYPQDYPCLTTKPPCDKCTGSRPKKLDSDESDPMFPLYPISYNQTPKQSKKTCLLDQDNFITEKFENKLSEIKIRSKVKKIEYNKVKPRYVAKPNLNFPVLCPHCCGHGYALKAVDRIKTSHIGTKPKMQNTEAELMGIGDPQMIKLKYNKVIPRYVNRGSNPNHTQHTRLSEQ